MPTTLKSLAGAVDEMRREGKSFDEIEMFIDDQDVDREPKSILWLWAWSELPRAVRRGLMPLEPDS